MLYTTHQPSNSISLGAREAAASWYTWGPRLAGLSRSSEIYVNLLLYRCTHKQGVGTFQLTQLSFLDGHKMVAAPQSPQKRRANVAQSVAMAAN